MPGEKEVKMSEYAVIHGDESAVSRYFNGCYGVAVYSEDGGEKTGALFHYMPFSDIDRFYHDFGKFVGENPEVKTAKNKSAVIIFPSSYTHPLNIFKSRIKECLQGVSVIEREYEVKFGEFGRNKFLLDLKNDKWEAWFAKGSFP